MKVILELDIDMGTYGEEDDEQYDLDQDSVLDGLASVDAEKALTEVLAAYYTPVELLTITDYRRSNR